MPEDTIFHKIVAGEIPCHKVYEDEKHLAFLSIFPNTEGVTVVIPKQWQPSNFADVPAEALAQLMHTAQKVAKQIERNLPGVGRVGLVFEGLGVDYLHAKLFPMHGVGGFDAGNTEHSRTDYYDTYPGYISSHDATLMDDDTLATTAAQIRGELNDK